MKNIIKILLAINITLISNTYSNSDAEQIEEACNLYNGLLEITHEYDKIISDIKKKSPDEIKHFENYTNAKIDDPNFCEILKNKIRHDFNQFSDSIQHAAQYKCLNKLIEWERNELQILSLYETINCKKYLTCMPYNTITIEECNELFKKNNIKIQEDEEE